MRSSCVKLLYGALLAAFLLGGVPLRLCAEQASPQAETTSNAQPPQSSAPAVTDFRVVAPNGTVLHYSGKPITLEIGKPLDRDQVAASIRSLYRTGLYSDIRVVSSPVAGGVRVDF